ncbi:MAG: hypothetical protein EA345_13040 [Halomonas sp.]|nr:MAG: hypothetical protein EA345_13040 [Halomonas sp.]
MALIWWSRRFTKAARQPKAFWITWAYSARLKHRAAPGIGRSEGLSPGMAKVAPRDGFTAPSRRPIAGAVAQV